MKKGRNQNEVYIYDINKINFYLEHNVQPKRMGVNNRTNCTYLVFDYYETQEVYTLWATRNLKK
ncbi:MAG: hypothetical protein E7A06_13225 [Clostridiales bacterium]|nr:hypothetical protein [Clostridiales bacterium]